MDSVDLNLRLSADRSTGMSRAAEQAYSAIRDGIMNGALKPGDSLVEQELAEKIGVSRTPVRQALARLGLEGLVILERYHRNYVAHFEVEDIEEVFEIRAMLEGYSAGRAAARIDAETLLQLEELARLIEGIVEHSGPTTNAEFNALNRKFHQIVRETSGCRRIEKILRSSLDLPFNLLASDGSKMEEKLREACWYHREIIAALKSHRTEWASSVMRAHILSTFAPEL